MVLMSGKAPGEMADIVSILDSYLIQSIERRFGDAEVIFRLIKHYATEHRVFTLFFRKLNNMAKRFASLSNPKSMVEMEKLTKLHSSKITCQLLYKKTGT